MTTTRKIFLASSAELKDDRRVGRLLDGLAAMVPGAIGLLVSTFTTPLFAAVTGPVPKFVLAKPKGSCGAPESSPGDPSAQPLPDRKTRP